MKKQYQYMAIDDRRRRMGVNDIARAGRGPICGYGAPASMCPLSPELDLADRDFAAAQDDVGWPDRQKY